MTQLLQKNCRTVREAKKNQSYFFRFFFTVDMAQSSDTLSKLRTYAFQVKILFKKKLWIDYQNYYSFRIGFFFRSMHTPSLYLYSNLPQSLPSISLHKYSVMQSDGNSIGGDVFSGSFNKTSQDEENILDQLYKRKYVRIINVMILILYNIIQKSIQTQQ